MNYSYQFTMVDYSSGQNDSGGDSNPTAVDHNDWAALDVGAFNVGGEGGIQGASLSMQRSRDEWLHERRAIEAAPISKRFKVK